MKYEKITIEIIEFLQKWGLWESTLIFSDGNMYAYSSEKTDTYNGIPYVKFEKNVDSTKYTTENGKNYSNPEHLLDIVFDSSLHTLLADGDYGVNGGDLSHDAWEEIFQYRYFINHCVADDYDVFDAEDILQKIAYPKESDSSMWNALGFASRDDYLNSCEIVKDYKDHNSDSLNAYEKLTLDDVLPLWDKLSEIVKNEVINDYQSERFHDPAMASYIKEQFNKIFEKYGLWYDFGFSWSLTCYKK